MKKKYTKCSCCPYYAKTRTKWTCTYDRCVFHNISGDLKVAESVLSRWIEANKENKDE